ncbi:hypothetical protein D3C87_2024050 [compost metagenome]
MLGAQRARRRFQPLLIAGDQQQIETTRRQALGVDRTDAGRSTGDEGCTLGLDRIHDSAPAWKRLKERQAPGFKMLKWAIHLL